MALYRIDVQASTWGKSINNIFHVQRENDVSPDLIAAKIRTAWEARLLPVLSTAYALVGVEARELDSDSVPGYATASANAVGTVAGEQFPTFAVASVRLNTTRRGRAGQGRMGLGTLAEGQCNGPQLTGAARTAITTAVENFRLDLAAVSPAPTMLMCVVSTTLNGRSCRSCSSSDLSSSSREIDRATSEVIAARAAAHLAVP